MKIILFCIVNISLLLGSIQMQKYHEASKGDKFEGVVYSREGNNIVVSVFPCGNNSGAVLIQFSQPYRYKVLGKKTCSNGTEYTRVRVTKD